MADQVNHIPFDQLLKYIFGELTEGDHQAMDDIILNDEYYYDLVQNIMTYCEQHDLRHKSALEKHVETHKTKLYNKANSITPPSTTKPKLKSKGNKNKWLLLIPLILLGLIALVYFNQNHDPKEKIPPPVEQKKTPPDIPLAANTAMDTLLLQFWEEEKDGIGGAGGDANWEVAFQQKDFSLALQRLEEAIKNSSRDQPQLFYFAGLLQLYLKDGSSSKALDYIMRAKPFRNDTEYDYSKHLIIALAQNKQYEAAAKLLDQFPQYQAFIPQDLLREINLSNK